MHRAPIIGPIGPRIGSGPNGHKFVKSVFVSDGAPTTTKIRIEGCKISVFHMTIAPARIGLPNLYKCMGHAAARFIKYAPMDAYALADGQFFTLAVVQD